MVNAKETKRIMKSNMIIDTCKLNSENSDDAGIGIEIMISMVCQKFGSGKRYVKEIVDDLINLKRLTLNDKKLYYVPT